MITRDWHGCYTRDWNGTLHPDAYVHPAKVAYGLAERIYNHCLAQGYFRPGDTVLDPFFGVGGFAFHALLNGLNVVGVELESNFVELARKNLELWRGKYGPGVAVLDDLRARGKLAPYGAATVLQGDSRQLRQVVAGAQGAVSSPPYADSIKGGDSMPERDRQHRLAIGRNPDTPGSGYGRQYGDNSPGQLGAMHAVSSPPYADGAQHTGGPTADTTGQGGVIRFVDYGESAGQLAKMHSIGSPPFADSLNSDDPDKRGGLFRDEKRRNDRTLTAEYGDSAGQLGRMHTKSRLDNTQQQVYNGGIEKELKNASEIENATDQRTLRDVPERDVNGRDSEEVWSLPAIGSGAIQEGESAHSGAIRSSQIGLQDGQESKNWSGDNGGPRSLGLEGRQGTPGISEQSTEGKMRDLRISPEFGDSSQRHEPLQQQPRQSASPLCILPHEPSQESPLGSDQEGRDPSEIKWPGRVGAVSSPPYAETSIASYDGSMGDTYRETGLTPRQRHGGTLPSEQYNKANTDNLGNSDDFWSAASLIMSEVAAVLPPGSFAVWVCKRFVRDGQIVEFSQQWAALGEHHGFETVEWIRAWLVEEQAGQMTLEGDVKRKTRERKSFFRRLAESKGSPRIDWEDVVIQVRR